MREKHGRIRRIKETSQAALETGLMLPALLIMSRLNDVYVKLPKGAQVKYLETRNSNIDATVSTKGGRPRVHVPRFSDVLMRIGNTKLRVKERGKRGATIIYGKEKVELGTGQYKRLGEKGIRVVHFINPNRR